MTLNAPRLCADCREEVAAFEKSKPKPPPRIRVVLYTIDGIRSEQGSIGQMDPPQKWTRPIHSGRVGMEPWRVRTYQLRKVVPTSDWEADAEYHEVEP